MISTLFESYPIIASLLIAVVSLAVGAIELDAVKSKGPALFTWFVGGMAAISPLANLSYARNVVFAIAALLLVGYFAGAYILLKRK